MPIAPPQQNCSMNVEYDAWLMSSEDALLLTRGSMSAGEKGESAGGDRGEGVSDWALSDVSENDDASTVGSWMLGRSEGVTVTLETDDSELVDELLALLEPRAGREPGPVRGDDVPTSGTGESGEEGDSARGLGEGGPASGEEGPMPWRDKNAGRGE